MNDSSFEGDAPAWAAFPPDNGDHISARNAHSGSSSAMLNITGDRGAMALTQSVNPRDFPEFLSGYYRVDKWNAGSAYLQFVVKALNGDGSGVREVRFVVAGATDAPEAAADAKYVFLSRAAPQSGAWVYFAYPVADAFRNQTGSVPTDWSSITVSLELHALKPGADASAAFDDIYVGPQNGNPNHPSETRH